MVGISAGIGTRRGMESCSNREISRPGGDFRSFLFYTRAFTEAVNIGQSSQRRIVVTWPTNQPPS
jgi:hypothetical protein